MTFHAAQIYLLLHLYPVPEQERSQINLSEALNWMLKIAIWVSEDFLSHMMWKALKKFIWEINLFIHSSVT